MNLVIKLKDTATVKDLDSIRSSLDYKAIFRSEGGTIIVIGIQEYKNLEIDTINRWYTDYPIERMYLE